MPVTTPPPLRLALQQVDTALEAMLHDARLAARPLYESAPSCRLQPLKEASAGACGWRAYR